MIDSVVVTAVPRGAKIRIEATVPLPQAPHPSAAVLREKRLAALGLIEAQLETLIPELVLRCSEQRSEQPLCPGSVGQSGRRVA